MFSPGGKNEVHSGQDIPYFTRNASAELLGSAHRTLPLQHTISAISIVWTGRRKTCCYLLRLPRRWKKMFGQSTCLGLTDVGDGWDTLVCQPVCINHSHFEFLTNQQRDLSNQGLRETIKISRSPGRENKFLGSCRDNQIDGLKKWKSSGWGGHWFLLLLLTYNRSYYFLLPSHTLNDKVQNNARALVYFPKSSSYNPAL